MLQHHLLLTCRSTNEPVHPRAPSTHERLPRQRQAKPRVGVAQCALEPDIRHLLCNKFNLMCDGENSEGRITQCALSGWRFPPQRCIANTNLANLTIGAFPSMNALRILEVSSTTTFMFSSQILLRECNRRGRTLTTWFSVVSFLNKRAASILFCTNCNSFFFFSNVLLHQSTICTKIDPGFSLYPSLELH